MEYQQILNNEEKVSELNTSLQQPFGSEVEGQSMPPPPFQLFASSALQSSAALPLQLMDKPTVTNGKLTNIVNALFKENPAGGVKIGDGSAMAAANHEKNNPGTKIGGRSHEGKIKDLKRGLNKLVSKHANADSPVTLSPGDLKVAKDLVKAIDDAVSGSYTG